MVNARLTKLGLRFAIGGAAALLAARVEAVPVSVSMGVLLLAAGIGFVSLAFEAQTEGKGMIPLLLGLVAWVTGACLLIWPSMTVVTLVALLATYSTLSGSMTLLFASQLRPTRGWSWVLLAGVISLLLAGSTWVQFPLSGAAATTSLVGLNLLAMGGALVALQALGPAQA